MAVPALTVLDHLPADLLEWLALDLHQQLAACVGSRSGHWLYPCCSTAMKKAITSTMSYPTASLSWLATCWWPGTNCAPSTNNPILTAAGLAVMVWTRDTPNSPCEQIFYNNNATKWLQDTCSFTVVGCYCIPSACGIGVKS